ncbi:protein FAR1-RELATED SEQUENCE 8-like [Lactuca sativa]|uniref:protein FAR1-RELATED SEQUENCE 8-like n=1 Tax=Lactuca sativa TaxID=4236 RepID=UPI000CD8C689|nr:protein FAR1-RELATED SEQUENCE 8-like [Lactuca sativa]
MENKYNIDNNNKNFSDNNGRNVKQSQVNQYRKKIKRCGIYFGVGHDKRNCLQAMNKTVNNSMKEQSHVTHDYVSPGGSSYWIPVVSDHTKPKINSIVDSYSASLSMYYNYASLAGFDVRLGPIRTTESGIITQQHLLCNREGKPRTVKVDTLDPQHNKIQRRKNSFSKDAGKKKNIPTFSFGFKVVKKKLNSIFWADETAKYNYNAFGDVNIYDMVFVPFTGTDNHKKCVTFGIGLLSREDGSSYYWLLRAFLKAFKKQLTLVLVYQDPTLNKVVNEITSQLATNSGFRKCFHFIIWNSMLEPHDFEKAWKSCLHEFNISNNKWMQEMYGLRRRWVPAFFKDIPMSGLMRTTSLSKGQNWSFQNNTLTAPYLLMFMMTFEGVMERQRCNQFVNDFNTATTLPRFITYSPIEPHASKVYTHKKIYQVQKEISDSDNTCFQMSVTSNNGVNTIIVLENQKNITTRQPSSHVVDDKLEEYHCDCLTEDT